MASTRIYCIPRAEWHEMWARLARGTRDCGMNTAAILCDKTKRIWAKQYPDVPFSAWSNGRYEVQVEHALAAGLPVSDERIAEVTDDDLRYDGFAFPRLNARRAAIGSAD